MVYSALANLWVSDRISSRCYFLWNLKNTQSGRFTDVSATDGALARDRRVGVDAERDDGSVLGCSDGYVVVICHECALGVPHGRLADLLRTIAQLARDRVATQPERELDKGQAVITLTELSEATALDPTTAEAVMVNLAEAEEFSIRRCLGGEIRWVIR